MVYPDNHFYKHLKAARTVFYLCFLTLIMTFFIFQTVSAQENGFTVDNVKVDVTADNAVEAREQAFQAAQIRAYEMLAKRMLSEEEYKNFDTPSLGKISSLVSNFEVKDEKLSTTRYNGTYKIAFRPHPLGQKAQVAIAQKQAAQTAVKKLTGSKTLIIPVIQKNGANYIWVDDPYRDSWRSVTQTDGIFVLPAGNAQDRMAISDNEAMRYDYSQVKNMMASYNTDEAFIVVANPQSTANQAPAVEVKLYQVLSSGPSFMKQMLIPIYTGEQPDVLFNRVASQSKIILENEMMAINSRKAQNQKLQAAKATMAQGPTSKMTAQLSFNSMREWVNLKKNIEGTNGIKSLIVKSMSARNAVVDIEYQGDIPAVAQNFRQKQLMLKSPIGGANYGQPPLYELTTIR